MSGPCSFPNGNRAEWEKMNEMACNIHKYCRPGLPVGDEETRHELGDHACLAGDATKVAHRQDQIKKSATSVALFCFRR